MVAMLSSLNPDICKTVTVTGSVLSSCEGKFSIFLSVAKDSYLFSSKHVQLSVILHELHLEKM